jgi:hypothetical protein
MTNRLSGGVPPPLMNYAGCHQRFPVGSEASLRGTIPFLTKEHSGNIHDRVIVGVTATAFDQGHDPKNAVDFGQRTYISLQNVKNRRVRLTDYCIASPPENWFLRSWVIEWPHDAKDDNWDSVDSRTNNRDANYRPPIAVFRSGNRNSTASFDCARPEQTQPERVG